MGDWMLIPKWQLILFQAILGFLKQGNNFQENY